MTYTFAIKAIPYHRMTRFSKWTDKAIAYRSYQHRLHWLAKKQKFVLPESFIVEFILPVPPSYSLNEKAKLMGRPHQKKPDVSNLLKAFEDSLMENDQVIWNVTAIKRYGEKGVINVTV